MLTRRNAGTTSGLRYVRGGTHCRPIFDHSQMSSVPESASGRSSSLKGQANQSQYQALLFRHGIGIADLPTERRLKDAEGLVTTGGPGSGVTTDEEMAGWIDLLYCANLASHMPDF